jgi:hypothetical protein
MVDCTTIGYSADDYLGQILVTVASRRSEIGRLGSWKVKFLNFSNQVVQRPSASPSP